jgi:hypothetical protein
VVWVRGAAIRPVPAYARIGEDTLDALERELAHESDGAQRELDLAFRRFEDTQPSLADKMSDVLAKPIDETALALGYFLSIAIWLAFDRTFGERLSRVTDDSVHATEAAIALEEELRASHGHEPLELDDVVAMEQPGILAFVHEHVEAALDPGVDSDSAEDAGGSAEETGRREVDVDDVHAVYREILVLALALSHAVTPDGTGAPRGAELPS